ncbi:hypothetical protein EMPS_07724 [Entomortierella parvispora]|uniref:Mitochondrial adapter protein MCP1 transmembrane domain-containing protein n=1 Tax=Entomortierella parvispora TaxID=205924 RepID=A0A9P3HEP0_9FUNG|nr:hypothetical protein EMPS_07724 [Entomortierella parvispora]
MTTVSSGGSEAPDVQPFNVWSKEETKTSSSPSIHDLSELDMEELIKDDGLVVSSEDGGSPTKFSAQTIRPKKGRQLLSSMITTAKTTATGSSRSSLSSPPAGTNASAFGTGSLPTPSSDSTTTAEQTTARTTEERDSKAASSTETETTPTKGFSGGGRGGFPSVGLYQGLGRLQAISALGFATFGLIHLIPPTLAAFGGIDLANKALILGRVYYQVKKTEGVFVESNEGSLDPRPVAFCSCCFCSVVVVVVVAVVVFVVFVTYGLEQVLVFGSFNVHLVTGLGRALIRLTWKAKAYFAARKQSSQQQDQQSLESGSTSTTTTTTITETSTSVSSSSSSTASTPGAFPWHRLVGWLLTPLVLGHMNAVRFKPLDAFGDSSMVDYSLITYIHRMGHRPPYVLLVGFMVYHTIGGGIAAYNAALPKGSKNRVSIRDMIKSRKARAVVTGVVTTVVMVGVYRILTAEGSIPMARLYSTLGF